MMYAKPFPSLHRVPSVESPGILDSNNLQSGPLLVHLISDGLAHK